MATTYKPILRTQKNEDGTHTVAIRITRDRVQRFFFTDIKVSPASWNLKGVREKYNWIRKDHPMHEVYNMKLIELIQKAEKFISPEMGIDEIRQLMGGRPVEENGFVFFFREIAESINGKIAMATYEKYMFEAKKFEEFLESRNIKDISIEKVDYALIRNYESWLLKNVAAGGKGNKQITANKSMAYIRTIIREAIRREKYKKADPFSLIVMKEPAVHKERLTREEIKKLEDVNLNPTQRLNDARNIFLMQFYCGGSRIGDMLCMRWEKIQNERWNYVMMKTKNPMNIPLNAKALDILKHYGYPNKKKGFVFPFLLDTIDYSDKKFFLDTMKKKTALINKYLKELTKWAEVEKKISTHIARHSFADILRQETNDIYAASKALGHKKISVTERYNNSLDQGSMDSAFDAMALL